MAFTDILLIQLTDPFRIVLLAALTLTTVRTAGDTGWLIPLALGAAFVAVLLPTAFGTGEATAPAAIGLGFVANAAILVPLLGGVWLWRRFGPSG